MKDITAGITSLPVNKDTPLRLTGAWAVAPPQAASLWILIATYPRQGEHAWVH